MAKYMTPNSLHKNIISRKRSFLHLVITVSNKEANAIECHVPLPERNRVVYNHDAKTKITASNHIMPSEMKLRIHHSHNYIVTKVGSLASHPSELSIELLIRYIKVYASSKSPINIDPLKQKYGKLLIALKFKFHA